MPLCHSCHLPVSQDEARQFQGHWCCEDCYLDLVGPGLHSVQYTQDRANFMRRLKETYSVIKQKFD